MFENAEIVSKYTNEDAIRDGVFLDVNTLTPSKGIAKEAGYKYPVYVTSNLFTTWIESEDEANGQSTEGRLWDVLYMSVRTGKDEGNMRTFQVRFAQGRRQRVVTLWAVCEPFSDSDPKPIVKIMLPADY